MIISPKIIEMFWCNKKISIEKKYNWNTIVHNLWYENNELKYNCEIFNPEDTISPKIKKIINVDVTDLNYLCVDDEYTIQVSIKFKIKSGYWDDYTDLNFYIFCPLDYKYIINKDNFEMQIENNILSVKFIVDLNGNRGFYFLFEIIDHKQDTFFDINWL